MDEVLFVQIDKVFAEQFYDLGPFTDAEWRKFVALNQDFFSEMVTDAVTRDPVMDTWDWSGLTEVVHRMGKRKVQKRKTA